MNLQQQKLLELTSLCSCRKGCSDCIYNSRNYQSLLANCNRTTRHSKSTIVEIIRAYQPYTAAQIAYQQSTIVEIIRAYQPQSGHPWPQSNLQQQKLLELTSLTTLSRTSSVIYNSRNYQSLLATSKLVTIAYISTIVEIIRAYQP